MPTVGGSVHLIKRFFGSLRPGPPPDVDIAWAGEVLTLSEWAIWQRMRNPDKRHSIYVAKLVSEALDAADIGLSGDSPPGDWFASVEEMRLAMIQAALMHDSGKVVSGLRTPARVLATVTRPFVSRSRIDQWASRSGIGARFGQYWRHPELGRDALRQAGSHRLVWEWAGQHHRPESRWTVPHGCGVILRDCDDD